MHRTHPLGSQRHSYKKRRKKCAKQGRATSAHSAKEIAGLSWTKSEKMKELNVVIAVGGVEVEVGAVVAVASRVVAEVETMAGVGVVVVVGYVTCLSMFNTRVH